MKHANIIKSLSAAAALLSAVGAWAETWTDPDTGYTWTYWINEGEAGIGDGYYYDDLDNPIPDWATPAVTPSPIGEIVIPSTLGGCPVTSIGDLAFAYCGGITKVTIPESVISIESRAFSCCDGLKTFLVAEGNPMYRVEAGMLLSQDSEMLIVAPGGMTNIVIPESVTSIMSYAFAGCGGLTSVTIPYSVSNIGSYAFYDCSGLTSVTIPDGVTSIGHGAFSGCSGLMSMTIPNGVTSVCTMMFYNCSSLTNVTIPGSVMSIADRAFSGCSGLTSITIPDGVTSVGSRAFFGCSGLISATIPNSVSSIGDRAFSGCSGLKSVTIPIGVTRIGNYVFNNCSGLASVTIPDGVTSIGDWAFAWCSGLASVTIPDSVTSIGSKAFQYCANLTDMAIGNGVMSIGDYAFSGCSGLRSVTIPDSVISIGDGVFSGCSGLESVTIPNGVTCIGNYVFNNCSGLASVTIPDGVTSIGDWAFAWCSGLASVTIPDSVTNIGSQAFQYCANLTDVAIGCGVTCIGDYAFSGCSGLTSVTIPDSVISIGDGVFSRCSELESFIVTHSNLSYKVDSGLLISKDGKTLIAVPGRMDSVSIPDGVTAIGNGTFAGCDRLTSVTMPDSVTAIGIAAFEGCLGLTNVTIPNGVTSIEHGAFAGCSGLTVVTIPNGVTSIGPYAFAAEGGSLACLTIPASVTNIGSYAFAGHSCLTSVTIPDGVAVIGDGAFSGCGGLMSFSVAESNAAYMSVAGFLLTRDGKMLVAGVNCDVAIPDGVESIGPCAFSGRSGLTSVTMPDSITSIGDDAFSGCSGLTSVTIPDGVTSIGDWAFSWCGGLTSVTIGNGVTSIGDSAFYGCRELTSVIIPDGVTNIGYTAFANCSGLVSVTIGNSVRHIKDWAFRDCSSLTSVTIPSSVMSIGYSAFDGCSGLTSVYVSTGDVDRVKGLMMSSGFDVTQVVIIELGVSRVVFDANGGEGGWSQLMDYGTGLTAPRVARVGYTFVEWSPEVDATVPASNVTYTAQWRVNQYTVTFAANGGDGGGVGERDYASELVAPEVKRMGYSFIGWTPEVDAIVPASDVTYTAQWQANKYTVKFNANGGEGTMPDKAFEFDKPDALDSNVFVRAYYDFVGWATNEMGEAIFGDGAAVSNLTAVDGGVVDLYAIWSRRTHTVRFYPNKRFDPMQLVESRIVGEGLALGELPAEPTAPEGCHFAGWREFDFNPKVPVNSDTIVERDMEICAIWDANVYTVTFDANGGEGGTTVTQDYGTALAAPVVTRIGYTFTGWSPAVPATVPAGNVTYTAQWKINQYTVTFNANGGAGGTTVTQNYGTTLTAPTVTRTGYTFMSWSPAVPAKIPAGNAAYVAQWKINRYKATLVLNGGDGTGSVEVNYGTRVGALPIPTRRGHTFIGWFTASEGGERISDDAVVTGAMTLYAQWEKDAPELYEEIDGPAPAGAASEYNGYLFDSNGAVKGTIQVKVGKPNAKTGLATIKATVVIGTKKVTLKGADKGKAVLSADGPTELELVGGEACEIALGAEGLSGYYGAYEIGGARNLFASKDKNELAAVNGILSKWLGSFMVIWDGGTLSVSVAAKGKVKVTGTLANGTKVMANTVLLVGEEWSCISVAAQKANLAFVLWLSHDGKMIEAEGLPGDVHVGLPGTLASGATFRIDADEFAAVFGQTTLPYFPNGVAVKQSGTKWTLPKAGKVVYKNGVVDATKLGENPCGLKLTYTAKSGTFKGSFKVYTVNGAKVKATTVNVTGLMLNGVGYGTATVKGKGSVAVMIE